MKNLFALFLFAALALNAAAGTTQLLGSLISVPAGTSNSPSVYVGSVIIPPGTFIIANGGLNGTNSAVFNEQISFDNTNFVTVNTFSFSATNAASASFLSGNYTNRAVYTRIQAVTTNTVSVGGSYVQ